MADKESTIPAETDLAETDLADEDDGISGVDDRVKRFAVIRLATFIKQSQVIAEVKAQFGVDLTRDQICRLDPTNPSSRMGKRLSALFWEKRNAYVRDEDAVPIAHRAFRLQQLTEMLFEEGKIPTGKKEKRAILRQAAEEMGGMYVRPVVKTAGVLDKGDAAGGTGTGDTGDGDADDGGADRTRTVRRLLGTARNRRIRASAQARRTGPPAAAPGGTEDDH